MTTEAVPDADERRLVTIETIAAIVAIEGADAIEAAHVRGWTVVVKRDQFAVGDQVVYIEVDAALPIGDERFAFLAARGTKVLDGVDVHVLKTARLRGVYSQGIVFPLGDFPEFADADDVASLDALIGVAKWETPPPPGMAALGPFPAFLQKTDAERVQNLDDETWAAIQADAPQWRATEKVDGTSLTAWRTKDGALHVAGRNWELDPATTNVYWEAVAAFGIADGLEPGQWVQGEIAGGSVQGNPLKFDALRVLTFGFGTFDAESPSIRTTSRTPMDAWPDWVEKLSAPAYDFALPATVREAVDQVETLKSILAPGRDAEGVVWTRIDGVGLAGLGDRAAWKSISARYLTKHGG
ncbi:RNA ligase (ATP) [Nocardioides sp. BGMRC 2183]|nr:RNA ligase (ATP) [Nocardioides sp. BGMRC 2183]